MKIIKAGRQTGKTTTVVTELEINPEDALVVFSEVERQRIIREFDPEGELNFAERIYTIYGVLDGQMVGKKILGKVHIDNLDMCLAILLRTPYPAIGYVTTMEG